MMPKNLKPVIVELTDEMELNLVASVKVDHTAELKIRQQKKKRQKRRHQEEKQRKEEEKKQRGEEETRQHKEKQRKVEEKKQREEEETRQQKEKQRKVEEKKQREEEDIGQEEEKQLKIKLNMNFLKLITQKTNEEIIPEKLTTETAHFYSTPVPGVPDLANMSLEAELAHNLEYVWELDHLCNGPGHCAGECRDRLCYQCGNEDAKNMPSGCYHCVLIPEASEPCVICKKLGHTRPFECADNLFQMYGLSIEPGEGSVAENENPDASQLVCCTCEDCTEPTIEPFVASMLPVEEN